MTTERSIRRSWWRAVLTAAAAALAFAASAGAEETIIYFHQDALGSVRLVTGNDGEVLARHDYLPFGEEVPAGQFGRAPDAGYGAIEVAPQHFTGKERDTESGLDYFGARYYSGAMGRWTSPDAPFADQYIGDPQSWNLYGYVRNRPLRYVDPTGEGAEELALNGRQLMATGNPVAGVLGIGLLAVADVAIILSDPQARAIVEKVLSQTPEADIAIIQGNAISGRETSPDALSPMGREIWEKLHAAQSTQAQDGQAQGQTEEDSGQQEQGTTVPDSYWTQKKAPTQVAPGTGQVTDKKPSSRNQGETYDRATHYDQYGRSTGQTHHTSHGQPSRHPNPHHHVRDPKTGQTSGPRPGVHPEYRKPESGS